MSESIPIGEFLTARDLTPYAPSRFYQIETLDGANLGYVHWFGRWWCYAFKSKDGTVLEPKCMRALADWMEQLTLAKKATWKRNIK